MKKVTIAVDSFKGSLSSREVAEALEAGVRSVCPHCEVCKVSIADGGEGTVEAIVDSLGGEIVEIAVPGPLGAPTVARYGMVANKGLAIVEMASASGLPLLSPEERNPMLTSTLGTGEIIADAIRRGCRRFLVGIGGSATNDAGIGMLHALGYRFVDKDGEVVEPCGGNLSKIRAIDRSGVMEELAECEFTVACDVTNPLYGPNGAAYVYAPQKGATPQMVELLDEGLRNFAHIVRQHNGLDVAPIEGAGAAGGLGAGFVALLGARLQRGIGMVMEALQFDRLIEGSDLVITGEGRVDRQTVMGKAPSGVLEVASAQGIPVVAVGGGVAWCKELAESGFAAILPIVSGPISLEEAMRPEVARENLTRTATQIVKLFTTKQ